MPLRGMDVGAGFVGYFNMRATIYHNPRCSKSRAALALLEERNLDIQIVKYLETPPSMSLLASLIDLLGLEDPRDMMRKKDALYKELHLDTKEYSKIELIEILTQNPKLIERPIVVANGRAAIGRPIEKIQEILDAERGGHLPLPPESNA